MPIQPGPESTFAQQFQQFMYYAGPLVQIVFWVGVLVIALLAYLQFKRLVDSKVAAILYAQAGPTPAESDDIAVEDFAD